MNMYIEHKKKTLIKHKKKKIKIFKNQNKK